MSSVASHAIAFNDLDTGAEAQVLLRTLPGGGIGLGITHREDGDLEACLDLAAARAVLDALRETLDEAGG